MQIELPPEIAERLHREAKRLGEAEEAIAIKTLDRYLPLPLLFPKHKDPKKLLELIELWKREDENLTDEELAENEQVLRNIDAERPEGQKLFTEYLKSERD